MKQHAIKICKVQFINRCDTSNMLMAITSYSNINSLVFSTFAEVKLPIQPFKANDMRLLIKSESQNVLNDSVLCF